MCNAITLRFSKTSTADALLPGWTLNAVVTAVELVVWLAPVLVVIIQCQVIIAFACTGNTGAVHTRTAIPPVIGTAVCTFTATIIDGVINASILNGVSVFLTGSDVAF